MEIPTTDMRVRWRDFEFPNRVILDPETATDTYGKFTAEPFEDGFGNTIGNSLRRILLSSIEGIAVQNVRIEGVEHELSAVEGVREDVPEIISNIKQLVLDLDESRDQHTIHIDVSEKGIVKAGHIQPDPAIEVINPDQHIATLNEEVEFKVEIDIERGRGYLPREEHSENGEIGNIAVDSLYSPIRRVRHNVEDTRVGRATDFDRLIVEIWTDGSVSPEKALTEGAKILRKHLNPFVQYFEIERRISEKSRKKSELWKERKKISETKETLGKEITELDIPTRTLNLLEEEGYETIEDLVRSTEEELLDLHGFGDSSLEDVSQALDILGLEPGMDLSDIYGGKETYFEARKQSGDDSENETPDEE